MFNPIEEKRRFVQAQIQKSFESGINENEEIDLEKAHKDGDHHPTKPWVWVSSANGGKGDWRVEGGRYHKKAGASTADTVSQKDNSVTSKEFSKNKAIVGEMLKDCDSKIDSNGVKKYHCKFYALGKDRGSSWFKKSDIEAYLRNYNDAKITAIKSEQSSTTPAARKPGSKVDITKIPDAEFKRITQMLEKQNPDHRDAERYLEEEAMSDKELKNFYAVAEHFKNSGKINKLTQEYCRKWAELARQEMQYRKKANSASSNTTNKGVKAPFQVLKPEVWKLAQQYNSATGSMKSKLKTTIDGMTNGDAWTHGDYTAYFYDDDIDEYVAVTREDWSNNIPPRKPGSTDEIERITAQGVRSSILGLNNIATNVKDKGDHFLIEFDHNDFNTNGKRSPQIDRIAKFLESMGASCVIGKNGIKAYKKVEAKKTTANKQKGDFSNMKLTEILDSLDNWEDDDWQDSKLNEKLSSAISSAIKKENISETEFKKIAKNYQGLDLQYSDYVEKKPDFEEYSKNFIAEYRKNHPNDSGTKNSDLRGQALKSYNEKYKSDKKYDPRDKVAHDAGFKDYEEMKGYQDYVTQKNLLKKKSTKAGMRLLYQQEVDKYERDHADLIKRISKN